MTRSDSLDEQRKNEVYDFLKCKEGATLDTLLVNFSFSRRTMNELVVCLVEEGVLEFDKLLKKGRAGMPPKFYRVVAERIV